MIVPAAGAHTTRSGQRGPRPRPAPPRPEHNRERHAPAPRWRQPGRAWLAPPVRRRLRSGSPRQSFAPEPRRPWAVSSARRASSRLARASIARDEGVDALEIAPRRLDSAAAMRTASRRGRGRAVQLRQSRAAAAAPPAPARRRLRPGRLPNGPGLTLARAFVVLEAHQHRPPAPPGRPRRRTLGRVPARTLPISIGQPRDPAGGDDGLHQFGGSQRPD